MMTCNACGATNQEQAHFCANCGAKLPEIQPHQQPPAGAAADPQQGVPAFYNPWLNPNQAPVQNQPRKVWYWILFPILGLILLVGTLTLLYFLLIRPGMVEDSQVRNRATHISETVWTEPGTALGIIEGDAQSDPQETSAPPAVTSSPVQTASTSDSATVAPSENTVSALTETGPPAAVVTETSLVTTATPSAVTVPEPQYPPRFSEFEASSTLRDTDFGTYSAFYAFDGNHDTSWVEGATDDGIGEWIELRATEPQAVNGLRVMGGYNKSQWLFDTNHRPALLLIQFDDGARYELELNDGMRVWNDIRFDETHATQTIRLTILSTYYGDDMLDTCISEIEVY